jgi:hypothetical protein
MKTIWVPPTTGIGSGSISRRIILRTEYEKNKPPIPIRSRKNKLPKKIPKSRSGIKYPSPESRVVFGYWQRLGFPFIKHKEQQSQTVAQGLLLIEKAVRKYSKNQVVNSMSTAHVLFNAPWFKHRNYFAAKKISLPSFMRYSNSTYNSVSRRKFPRSWFQQCRKPVEILQEKYGTVKKVEHPKVVKLLTDAWIRYSGNRKISTSKANRLAFISERLYKFCENNPQIDLYMVLEVIDKMLNEWKSYKPKNLGYLGYDSFLHERLPDELLRYGVIDRQEREELNLD